jgi:hypothetical protein
MGNWTKEGFIGAMFRTFARFLAPPGMPSPVLWGDETIVADRFGDGVVDLRMDRVNYRFDYPFGPEDVVDFFRRYYGPTTKAFATLETEAAAMLRSELVELWASNNQADQPGRTIVDAEYLDVHAVRA